MPDYWADAQGFLCENDSVLAGIINAHSGFLESRGDAFTTLARAVAGQQISTKAAASVWGKFEQAVGDVVPENVLLLQENDLRSCGFSGRKVMYIQGIAKAFAEEEMPLNDWHVWEDEAVIDCLVKLPGIGRWTAEMFLMFHFLRPNVLPLADLGLVKAFEKHYDLPKDQLPDYAATYWNPYKSVATWYLWRSLDPKPVAY